MNITYSSKCFNTLDIDYWYCILVSTKNREQKEVMSTYLEYFAKSGGVIRSYKVGFPTKKR